MFVLSSNFIKAQTCYELQKIVASDRGVNNKFGYSLSVSGKFAVVGAPWNSEDANGTNTKNLAGAAYIFEKVNNQWVEIQKIVASDRTASDAFGWSVDIDGDRIVVGAWQADSLETPYGGPGAAYVFERNINNVWVETHKFISLDRSVFDTFGNSVSVSSDVIVVGDYSDEVGFQESGSAYVFECNSLGVWSQGQKITPSDIGYKDNFGYSVAIENNTIVCGARGKANDAGAAYIFNKSNSNLWTQTQKIVSNNISSNDYFGNSVDIDSNIIVVGAYNKTKIDSLNPSFLSVGAAYLFKRSSNGYWQQEVELAHSEPENSNQFGFSVSIHQPFVLVTSLFSRSSCGVDIVNNSGDAYLFADDGSGNWFEAQNFVASDRVSGSYYGYYCAIDEDDIFISNSNEELDEQGLNPITKAGASYYFKVPSYSASINKKEKTTQINSIYPNPTNGVFTIDFGILQNTNLLLEIFDVSGKKMTQLSITKPKEKLDISNYENGIYFLRLNNNSFRILKQ